MKIVDVGGYSINPANVTYIQLATTPASSPSHASQSSIIHFVGGETLTVFNVAPFQCMTLLNGGLV